MFVWFIWVLRFSLELFFRGFIRVFLMVILILVEDLFLVFVIWLFWVSGTRVVLFSFWMMLILDRDFGFFSSSGREARVRRRSVGVVVVGVEFVVLVLIVSVGCVLVLVGFRFSFFRISVYCRTELLLLSLLLF